GAARRRRRLHRAGRHRRRKGETQVNAQTETKIEAKLPAPPLLAGGHVVAIVPQSLEEIWRVSTMVLQAGIAPKALVDKKVGQEAQSAVAIAIMAGAELGLPPMVA